jgi:hypothetical protein
VRQWITPRSLGLHLLFVVVAGSCLFAAWWQIHRAMAGNTLSYLYSAEWPAFAVVAGIGWWQMFHDTPEDIARRKAHHARVREASVAVVARTLPRSALALTVDSTEISGKALPPASEELTVRAPAIGTGEMSPDASALVTARPVPGVAGGDLRAGLEATLLESDDDPANEDLTDDLAAYNRYLALLAVRGTAKTWRNPRGIQE